MTPEYKARRAAKVPPETFPVAGAPRLAWLGGKLFKSSSGGLKTRSRYSQEHEQALRDNRNPYLNELDGKWYWYDETEQECETGFVTRDQAEIALNDYVAWLNSPKEVVAEPMPVKPLIKSSQPMIHGKDLL